MVSKARELAAQARELVGRVPGADAALESLQAEERSGSALLAGGLAYRLFFWLVAFGLLSAAILSFWVRSSPDDVEATAKSFGLAGVATTSATDAIQEGSNGRWYFLISGIVLVVYFGMGAMRAMHVSAVLAWRLEPYRLPRPLQASALFSGAVIVAIGAGLAAEWVRQHAPGVGLAAVCATGAVFICAGAVGYQLLPHAPVPSWRALLPGAIEVGIGMTAIQVFVVFYLAAKLERSPDLYGALGASTVVLLWLFLFARLIVSGMFLNATLERRRLRSLAAPQPVRT